MKTKKSYGKLLAEEVLANLYNISADKYNPLYRNDSDFKEMPFATIEIVPGLFVWFSTEGITVSLSLAFIPDFMIEDENTDCNVISITIDGRYQISSNIDTGINKLKTIAFSSVRLVKMAYKTSALVHLEKIPDTRLLPAGIKVVNDDYYGNDL